MKIREEIIKEMERQEMSQMRMAKLIRKHRTSVNRALRDGHDMKSSMAEKMLNRLGMRLVRDKRRGQKNMK